MLKLFVVASALVSFFVLIFWSIATSVIPAFTNYAWNIPIQMIASIILLLPIFLIAILVAVWFLGRE